jgi:dolichol-phosphate mannosyltransferase
VRGGKVVNWPVHRFVLSRGANLYTRLALGMPVNDATGGYRVYRVALLDKIDFESVSSAGYSFQVELSHRAHRAGVKIVEVPITFAERERGASKMSLPVMREALLRVTVWGLKARRDALRALGTRGDAAARWP